MMRRRPSRRRRRPADFRRRLAAAAQIRYEERARRMRRDLPRPIIRIAPPETGERACLIGAASKPLADLCFDPVGVAAG